MKQLSINYESSLKQLFNIFLTSRKAKGVQEKTLETYSAHLNAISKHLNIDTDIAELRKSDIDAMIVSMREANLSPNSIKSYLITLRAFINWCNEENLCNLKVGSYKGQESVKTPYTDAELALLLKKPNMRKCSFCEYRNWVIVNFLMNSGCRASTLRSIQIRDLDLNQGLCYYRHTKSKKQQVIPLCSQMVVILTEYLRFRKGKDDDVLFCSEYGEPLDENGLKSAIERYNKSRGVQKTSIHLFRHTFAKKYLLDCKGNAFTLQMLLGHSTLDMTRHYCAIYNADIANNYDEISPLAQFQKKKEKIKK